MSTLTRRAMAVRIGGPDAKLTLICLCAQAGEADCKASITPDMAEAALKASELTRKVFSESLKILRQRRLIGVTTGKDLAGVRVMLGIDIDLSRPPVDDPDVTISDGSFGSLVRNEALQLFRSYGIQTKAANSQIEKLLQGINYDYFKFRDAIVSANRARRENIYGYIKSLLPKGARDGDGLGSVFVQQARCDSTADT